MSGDGYGVPHIFAASMDDAARALGYVHASERLFQMEVTRRVGQGRVSEILGADFLNADKFIRTLGFYREAEASFSALSPWAQKRLQAYADGVNAFLESHGSALPPEFLIVGDRPEPWKPAGSLVFAKLESYELSHNYDIEALRARLREKLGPEKASWMFPGLKADAPITTLPSLGDTHASADSVEDQIAALTGIGPGASNEWWWPDRERLPASRSSRTTRTSALARQSSGISRGLSRRKDRSRGARSPGVRSSFWVRTTDRLGLHDREHRRAGPVHRDGRPVRSFPISDAGRAEAIRDARRNHSRQGRRRRQADRPDDAARSCPLRRQRKPPRDRRAGQGRRARLHRPRRPRHDR